MQKYGFFILALLIILSCRKGDLKSNQPPETHLSVSAINLTGDNRLNSEVRLSWFGTDIDGYIKGFEISLDQQNWNYTEVQDSTFIFPLLPGQDTTDIDFYVRAIDNEGLTDATPAYLTVPLKNTPPVAEFDNDRGPKDTAFCVSTFYWLATDPDGNETLEKVFLKFNNGNWTEINKNQNLISFLVDTSVSSGTATAQIYYAKDQSPAPVSIDGLLVNAENQLFIKTVDIAGAESEVDTANSFFLKNKTAGVNTLWINGHVNMVAQEYRIFLNNNGIVYDFLDYGSNMGANQPIYWDPTFRITLSLYDKVFINAPSSTFPNPVTGENSTLLDYIGPSMQLFNTSGGKSLTTCALSTTSDLTNIAGPFPIESMVSGLGTTRIYKDSLVYTVDQSSVYPDLSPVNTLPGIVPMIKAADSEEFYRAHITRILGGGNSTRHDGVVASVRRDASNNIKQAFFAIELHNYNKNPSDIEFLIGEILKNEF